MMNDFIDRWKKDKKYQAKIKLSLYAIFIIILSIYAISINNNQISSSNTNKEIDDSYQEYNDMNKITLPQNYTYTINISINNNNYKYSGNKLNNQMTFTKETPSRITNYILEDNKRRCL